MKPLSFLLLLLTLLSANASTLLAGSVTLTTYYPAPSGNYNDLQSNNLRVNGNGTGYLSVGTGGCGANWTALSLRGAMSGSCDNYNLAGSPSDNNLLINTPTGGDILFRRANATYATFAGNNLGIGETVPAYKLHISSNLNQDGIIINAARNPEVLFRENGTIRGTLGIGSSAGTYPFTTSQTDSLAIRASSGPIQLGTGTTAHMTINTSGLVEIAQNETLKLGNAYLSSGGNFMHIANNEWYDGAAWQRSADGALLQFNGQSVGFFRHSNAYAGGHEATLQIDASKNVTVPGGNLSVTAGNFTVSGSNTAGSFSTAGGYTQSGTSTNTFTGPTVFSGTSTRITTGYLQVTASGAAPGAPQNGDIYGTRFFYNTGGMVSDERLKKDIFPITHALDKVKKINGVEFTWKESGQKEIGVIAQNVEKVIPELILEDGNGTKHVKYQNMVGLLIEAIKEQQYEIDALKAEIQSLQQKSQQPLPQ